MLVQFLFIVALLFAGFRLLSFVAGKLNVLPQKMRHQIGFLLPIVELVVWVAVLLWMVSAIYVSKNYFVLLSMAILFALLAVPLFYLIRNFIAGIIFRIQNKLMPGMYINLEGIAGVVKRTGHLGLEIEDRQRNIRVIPYYTIRSASILRQGNNPHLEKVTLCFTLPVTGPIRELSNKLQREVLMTPWVAVSQPPAIESISHEEGKIQVDVGVFMPDRSYADLVKERVMHAMSD
jgi:hypothetical protein